MADIESVLIDRACTGIARQRYKMPDSRTKRAQRELLALGLLVKGGREFFVDASMTYNFFFKLFIALLCAYMIVCFANYIDALNRSKSGEYYRLLVDNGDADAKGAGNFHTNTSYGYKFQVGGSWDLWYEKNLDREQGFGSFILDLFPPFFDKFVVLDLGRRGDTSKSIYIDDVKQVNGVMEVRVSVRQQAINLHTMSRPAIRISIPVFFKPICIRAKYYFDSDVEAGVKLSKNVSVVSYSDTQNYSSTTLLPLEKLDGSVCAKKLKGI